MTPEIEELAKRLCALNAKTGLRREFYRSCADALKSLSAQVDTLTRERDNARAEVSWLARLMIKTRDAFSFVVSEIEDEGDRCYFGSTNDADTLRDIREKMETWEEGRLISDTKWEDYITKCSEAKTRIFTLEAQLKAFREAAEEIKLDEALADEPVITQRSFDALMSALQSSKPNDAKG